MTFLPELDTRGKLDLTSMLMQDAHSRQPTSALDPISRIVTMLSHGKLKDQHQSEEQARIQEMLHAEGGEVAKLSKYATGPDPMQNIRDMLALRKAARPVGGGGSGRGGGRKDTFSLSERKAVDNLVSELMISEGVDRAGALAIARSDPIYGDMINRYMPAAPIEANEGDTPAGTPVATEEGGVGPVRGLLDLMTTPRLPGLVTLGGDAAPQAVPQALPKQGDVINGYRFKGGEPNNKDNWEKL